MSVFLSVKWDLQYCLLWRQTQRPPPRGVTHIDSIKGILQGFISVPSPSPKLPPPRTQGAPQPFQSQAWRGFKSRPSALHITVYIVLPPAFRCPAELDSCGNLWSRLWQRVWQALAHSRCSQNELLNSKAFLTKLPPSAKKGSLSCHTDP